MNFRNGYITIDNINMEMNSQCQKDTLDEQMKIRYQVGNCNMINAGLEDSIFHVSKVQHRIDTIESKIIVKKQFPVPIALREKIRLELIRQIDLKYIRKSENGWASPAFAILKKNGDVRLIIDYRELNAITLPMCHPSQALMISYMAWQVVSISVVLTFCSHTTK